MIVLAARLMGTLFWPPNRTFNAKKKMVKENSLALKSIISNFEYSYQPKNSKKISCHKYFKQALSLFRSLDRASR